MLCISGTVSSGDDCKDWGGPVHGEPVLTALVLALFLICSLDSIPSAISSVASPLPSVLPHLKLCCEGPGTGQFFLSKSLFCVNGFNDNQFHLLP